MYNLSYSGMLYIDSHEDILDYCARAGVKVTDFNRCVRFENSVTDCSNIFACMKSFNKSVIFPSTVKKADFAFTGCDSFSQYIFIDYALYESLGRSPQALGLADTYPVDRIIVTNNNKAFDLYLGACSTFPPSIPGIIQLLRNLQPEEIMNCKMFFRSLPEFRFVVKNVYISIDSRDTFDTVSSLLDAAISVNPEMFSDAGIRISLAKGISIDFEEEKLNYSYLSKVVQLEEV